MDEKENFNSGEFWENRYSTGGNSGAGSYNHLALFKAGYINKLIVNHGLNSAIDFGCGDGNICSMIHFKNYLGVDVSKTAVQKCRELFHEDQTKSFILYKDLKVFSGFDICLSIDVIFHLVEDEVYEEYMNKIFGSDSKYVLIYSSNHNGEGIKQADHVKHRNFLDWVNEHFPSYHLYEINSNQFPFNGDSRNTSFCDFFLFKRAEWVVPMDRS